VLAHFFAYKLKDLGVRGRRVVMKKFLKTVALLLLSAIFITSCDKEEDDLILQPTETSTIITGYIRTPDGMPLANIPVSVDYTFKSVFGTALIHKAKGSTDKSGFYKVFFDFPEEESWDFRSSLDFSVDLSSLTSEEYFMAPKYGYSFPYTNELRGKNIECIFTVPHKTNVKVTINNHGQSIKEGDYAIRNMIPFFRCNFIFSDDVPLWGDDYNNLYWLEDVNIPQEGSTSLILPCAVGVKNSIQVVYKGNETIKYGMGIPCSDVKELFVTDNTKDEIVFDYFTPDIPFQD